MMTLVSYMDMGAIAARPDPTSDLTASRSSTSKLAPGATFPYWPQSWRCAISIMILKNRGGPSGPPHWRSG